MNNPNLIIISTDDLSLEELYELYLETRSIWATPCEQLSQREQLELGIITAEYYNRPGEGVNGYSQLPSKIFEDYT